MIIKLIIMDVMSIVRGRRSIRKYKSAPVPFNFIEKLVEAGQWAPTGANRQYWKFIVVTDQELMKKIKNVSPMMWRKAPAAIIICLDLTRNRMRPEARTGGVAGFPSQNILLEAYSLGLGTCAIAGFNRMAVKNLLEIPDNLDPLLLITVGYPDETPEIRPRRPMSEVAFLNTCKNPWRTDDE
jgi:nitroreductase